jgi:uracil-DNA glycosylase
MKNRQPKTGEIRACNPYLQGQIEAVKPRSSCASAAPPRRRS